MGSVLVVGSLNYDTALAVERIPAVGETVIGTSVAYGCGGKGANQACACARAGARTTLLGVVGDDIGGSQLRQSLIACGVRTEALWVKRGAQTGMAVVTVDSSGRNSIVVIPGANAALTAERVEAYFAGLEEAPTVVLLQLEIPLAAAYAAVRCAKAAGAAVALNPAPARRLDPAYVSRVDYLLPNETELALLAARAGDPAEQAEALTRAGVGHVVATLGERGALHLTAGGAPVYYAAHRVRAVDTVGAGDCFCGYFCAALAVGKSEGMAIAEATAAAAISVTRAGAQASIPLAEEVAALLKGEKDCV